MIIAGDCLAWMKSREGDSVDLVFGSPPYENARDYGIGFSLKGQDWVDWMVECVTEMVRISRGLVAMVVNGKTRNYRWSATPALLMADLHRAGIHLRKPPAFNRVGIPGSGGPDWLRDDYEFILCCTAGGKLPWSDNTAMGKPPKWGPGGEMSYRQKSGARRNKWGKSPKQVAGTSGNRRANGTRDTMVRPGDDAPVDVHNLPADYKPPAIANPGNVIRAKVGGGNMGHPLCHENEAPFPEKLAEFFIRSFCPPGGLVLDPFFGSGTTGAVAKMHGRSYIGVELREDQVELARRRIDDTAILI